jgi:acetyltransferase
MAHELIVGASVDPLFGPVLLFGQGGTAVEVLADRAIALPPLNRALARELTSRTRVAKLLAGYRDHPPAAIDAVRDVLIAVSQMLADLPQLAELDISPLWADHQGVIALDTRLRVVPGTGTGTDRFAILPYPASSPRRLRGRAEASQWGQSARRTKRCIARSSKGCRAKTCGCASSAAGASCRAASWRA